MWCWWQLLIQSFIAFRVKFDILADHVVDPPLHLFRYFFLHVPAIEAKLDNEIGTIRLKRRTPSPITNTRVGHSTETVSRVDVLSVYLLQAPGGLVRVLQTSSKTNSALIKTKVTWRFPFNLFWLIVTVGYRPTPAISSSLLLTTKSLFSSPLNVPLNLTAKSSAFIYKFSRAFSWQASS